MVKKIYVLRRGRQYLISTKRSELSHSLADGSIHTQSCILEDEFCYRYNIKAGSARRRFREGIISVIKVEFP